MGQAQTSRAQLAHASSIARQGSPSMTVPRIAGHCSQLLCVTWAPGRMDRVPPANEGFRRGPAPELERLQAQNDERRPGLPKRESTGCLPRVRLDRSRIRHAATSKTSPWPRPLEPHRSRIAMGRGVTAGDVLAAGAGGIFGYRAGRSHVTPGGLGVRCVSIYAIFMRKQGSSMAGSLSHDGRCSGIERDESPLSRTINA